MTSSSSPRLALLLGLALAAAAPAARAQTAVTALTGQTCAATRYGSGLNCTANDFTTSATFTQPPPGVPSCVAGSTIQLDAILNIVSNSPNRYDGAVFLGERGNDPSTLGGTCSLGVFPTSPAPFGSFDANGCGDFASTSTANLTIRQVTAYCAPAPGTNVLGLPYVLTFGNSTIPGCSAATITAATKSKCVASLSAQVTGVIVQGHVTIVQRTLPAGDPQAFSYTATGAGAPESFTLQDGGTQLVQVPLSPTGGSVTLRLDEAAVAGWKPGATISCTSPSGGAAPWVAVDAANRRITATLNATTFGAVCTVTNERQLPNLVVVASADSPTKRPGDVVTFTLSVQNAGDGAATSVVLGGPVSPLLAWRLGGFSGAAFQLVDGAPPAGLTPGPPTYSADGGATFGLVPASGGGGAPAGADARVQAWRLPLAGTMPAGARFSLSYQAVVR